MNKNELVNNVMVSMQEYLDRKQQEQLKNVLVVNFAGYELTQTETLPSTIVFDNEYILKRFSIDMLAKGIKKSTIEQYVRMARKFFRFTNKNYREVTGQDIVDFVAIYQYQYNISNNYKSTMQKYLSSFFGWAYRKRHIEDDIMRDVDPVKPEQKRKVRLTDMQVEDLREAAKTLREKALLEFMLSTGCRVSEIILLNKTDVDLHGGRVTIYAEKTSSYRTGFLNTKAKKALWQYINSRTDDNEALFVTARGACKRMSKSSVENIVKSLGALAKVPFITTVHVYRKTFASIQYIKTGDILYVSKLLGHASTDVTIKYYLVDDIDEMQRKHDKAA